MSLLFLATFQALSVTERGSPEEVLDLAFKLYDIDDNGTIEMRELAEILRVSSITFFCIMCTSRQLSLAIPALVGTGRNGRIRVTV